MHFPSSVCNSDTILFKGVQPKKRVCRYYIYVGGIDKRYGSEEILRNYCQGRNIRVTFVRYFDKPYKRTASAQLNVVADDGVIISNPDLWPAGIFTKPWLSRQQFISEHSNYQNGR